MTEDAAGLQDPLRSALAALANPNAVLDALGHAVIVTDIDGRIVQWNRAAAELYGVKRDDDNDERCLSWPMGCRVVFESVAQRIAGDRDL